MLSLAQVKASNNRLLVITFSTKQKEEANG